jgi:hypothetical protein
MNTNIKFKHLLWLLFIAAIGFTFGKLADEYTYIGNCRLRYDSDTAMLKFSKMIGREYGGQLFLFNNTDFNSDNGLSLDDYLDSNLFYETGVYADTSEGELPYMKMWVINRDKFVNNNAEWDSMSINVDYYNTKVQAGRLARFYLLNKITILKDEEVNDSLLQDLTTLYDVNLPHAGGVWLMTYILEYEFAGALNDGGLPAMDSIYFRIRSLPSTDIGYATVKCYYPDSASAGIRGIAVINAIVSQPGGSAIRLSGLCSQDATTGGVVVGRYLKRIKIIAELIN